jgi:hypothetical protein
MRIEFHGAHPWYKEVIHMNRTRILGTVLLLVVLAFMIPTTARTEDEPFKWYGVGGEFNGARRWLGRFGITQDIGVEAIFGVDWGSGRPKVFDLGAGVIYDYAPTAEISPYAMCRFILHIEDNGEYNSDGRIEAGAGAEYVIKKRIGISAELNFSIGIDPSRVMTTTLVRAYFYL